MGGSTNNGGAARRRPFLLSAATAGVIAGLLGLSGVFAASTDRATTGGDRVATGEHVEPAEVDLQIAPVVNGGCGAWQDDLVTGLFDVTAATEDVIGRDEFRAMVCLRNHGPSAGTLSVLPIDVDDREVDCTGREAEVDGSCGNEQEGELAEALGLSSHDCRATPADSFDHGTLEEMAAGPRNLMTLPGGDEVVTLCFTAQLIEEISSESFFQRRAQSDEVTWRFAFDLGGPDFGCQQLDHEPNSTFEVTQRITPGTAVVGSLCKHDRDIFSFSFTGAQRAQGFTAVLTWPAEEGELLFLLTTTPGSSLPLPTQKSPGRIVITASSPAESHVFYAVVRGDPFGTDGPVTSSGYELRIIPTLPPIGLPG